MKKYKLSEFVLKNDFGEDVYLHNTETNSAIQLVGATKVIIEYISKSGKSLDEVVKIVCSKFDVDYDRCKLDTENILRELISLGFISLV